MDRKCAFVSGGSRGIGKETVIRLAKSGINVMLNYKSNSEAAEETARVAMQYGVEVHIIQGDISNKDDVKRMIDSCVEKFGKIDILVNNAGITKDNLILRMKEEDFDTVIDTNLKGVFYCLKYASSYMVKQRYGRIINVASIIGVIGNAGQANYAAAKGGVIALTKSAAKELASRNITVNAVAPGFIETDMTAVLNEEIKKNVLNQIPLKRFGKTEDVANLINFLASDEASYITGQVIIVDGGMVM